MIKFRNALHNEKGFTLIELLVVVIIIGILAAVALPNLMGASDKAKEKRVLADYKVIGTALESYYADKSVYPTDLNDAKNVLVGADKYLKAWPKDPWDQDYSYSKTETGYNVEDSSTTTAVYLDETGIH